MPELLGSIGRIKTVALDKFSIDFSRANSRSYSSFESINFEFGRGTVGVQEKFCKFFLFVNKRPNIV